MSFMQAITSGFKRYVDFQGRSSRSEYWWWFLFSALINFALGFIQGLIEALSGERLERLAAVARYLNLVALERERPRESLLNRRLVIDYEDLGPLAHAVWLRPPWTAQGQWAGPAGGCRARVQSRNASEARDKKGTRLAWLDGRGADGLREPL